MNNDISHRNYLRPGYVRVFFAQRQRYSHRRFADYLKAAGYRVASLQIFSQGFVCHSPCKLLGQVDVIEDIVQIYSRVFTQYI